VCLEELLTQILSNVAQEPTVDSIFNSSLLRLNLGSSPVTHISPMAEDGLPDGVKITEVGHDRKSVVESIAQVCKEYQGVEHAKVVFPVTSLLSEEERSKTPDGIDCTLEITLDLCIQFGVWNSFDEIMQRSDLRKGVDLSLSWYDQSSGSWYFALDQWTEPRCAGCRSELIVCGVATSPVVGDLEKTAMGV
jgi:hypothetical protein